MGLYSIFHEISTCTFVCLWLCYHLLVVLPHWSLGTWLPQCQEIQPEWYGQKADTFLTQLNISSDDQAVKWWFPFHFNILDARYGRDHTQSLIYYMGPLKHNIAPIYNRCLFNNYDFQFRWAFNHEFQLVMKQFLHAMMWCSIDNVSHAYYTAV